MILSDQAISEIGSMVSYMKSSYPTNFDQWALRRAEVIYSILPRLMELDSDFDWFEPDGGNDSDYVIEFCSALYFYYEQVTQSSSFPHYALGTQYYSMNDAFRSYSIADLIPQSQMGYVSLSSAATTTSFQQQQDSELDRVLDRIEQEEGLNRR